jgi:uncharacterized membrane protein YphA (DoxX/SURF4 family)
MTTRTDSLTASLTAQPASGRASRTGAIALWVAQGLLAALFLFAGGVKLVLPAEALTAGPVALPLLFLRFIGVCEVLGAIGLVVPWATRIAPLLTPLAAAGLAVIMTGATTITALTARPGDAAVPLAVGVVTLWIAAARGRAWRTRTAVC